MRLALATYILSSHGQVFLDPVYGLVVGMVVALLRDAAETARAESRVTLDKAMAQACREIVSCIARLRV